MTQHADDSAESQQAPDRPGRTKRDFGIFYPVGYLVVGFPDEADALRVQQDLATGGYDAADCTLHRAREVIAAAERNLRNHDGFLATLGGSDNAVREHLSAARDGATLLLIYAPGELEASRAMNVVRRVGFTFAHRYHRFVIESMN